MPTAKFFILIPTSEKKERESFRSRQNLNLIAVNLLRPILVRAGTENSLFFRFLRRNQYESFRRWRFALVLFFS